MSRGDSIVVVKQCAFCDLPASVEVDRTSYERWVFGEHVQDVFPDMPADVREMLISGTHPDCWERHMRDPEDAA